MNYFDTSALIKLFVDEKGSQIIEKIILEDPDIFTSMIAYTEIFSGLARKLREKAITSQAFSKSSKEFEKVWSNTHRVKLNTEVLKLSKTLIQKYPLRAFDAIHLASALQLGEPKQIRMIATDNKLLESAKNEGLQVKF